MSILAQAIKKNQELIREEEEEEKLALINGSNINGLSINGGSRKINKGTDAMTEDGTTIIGGSKKNNESKKSDEDEFTSLLNKYALTKSKYEQCYKTLTPDQIKRYKDDFKQQEETLTKNYNLLKNKKGKYYCSNYTIELCKKQVRQKLTNKNLGKLLFKFYKEKSPEKSKDDINNHVSKIVNFIEKERINNEMLYIKCSRKKDFDYDT